MRLSAALAFLPLLFAREAPASLGIKQGKLSLSSPDGLSDASYTLDPLQPLPPLTLAEQTTLKLSFTVIDASTGAGVIPDQAHLLFEDTTGDESRDVTVSVGVKSSGRASFTLNTAKLPAALIHTRGTSNLTLFLSSLASPPLRPLAYPLTALTLSPSLLKPLNRRRHDLPPRAGEPAFAPQEELAHTFKKEEKSVGVIISLLGLGITLTPWVVLLGLISSIRPQTNPSALSSTSSLFFISLIALEILIGVYWVGLKLYQLLPAFIGLAGVSAYLGKVAMSGLREKRLKGQ
ncbi:uncharacterized protein MKK02DRAFT_42811 [Dioszegia hungarica]|uniref:Ribophorin II C-terminal domain-containing protein n=1 Tax=Dioszegia hungarica TaxID=4972 RepID=A0AA38HDW3_9TREE|nr:uncharacterized protein MKK02DRAFT_42811 [Dioszegia hungarica]KAI9638420.1 hypothetical protein MKK02DRAFT_42811 [Dioszegia hungarica]